MEAPTIAQLRAYIKEHAPLGFTEAADITDIDPKPISGHFNFLVQQGDAKAVLRLKGPEWGEPQQGLIDEHRILEYVSTHSVAPQPLLLDEQGIDEIPVLFEEYLEGVLFPDCTSQQQRALIPDIAALIARINDIPIAPSVPFQESFDSYARHKKAWRERVHIASEYEPSRAWSERVAKLLPAAERMLDSFEPLLAQVIAASSPAFIFESAHPGHLLHTNEGLRFLNWEQVSTGDPSFTAAVFLAGLQEQGDFENIRQELSEHYRMQRPVEHFDELLSQRLAEREVSNLTWVLWAYANRRDERPIEEATSIVERSDRVKHLLSL